MNPLLMIQADMADVQTVVDTATAAAAPERITLWQMALNGGWIMIVLAVLLAMAIYIAVERYLALRQALNAENDNLFMNSIREYIHKGDVDAARSLSKKTNSPLARMVDKGLSRLGRPLSDIQATIENEGKLEVARLEKRVSLVATVASLGPMIGFLGTVTGMVTCFQDMAHAGNNIEINTLATGMYQAMVTTIGGLIVGIICYFLYNVLVTRINKVVLDIEVRATEFMDLLHEPAIETRNKLTIENNNSTMSDLVFLLLVFFMMTSTLISPNAVKLLLPESGSKTMAKQNVTVYIDENYNFQVNNTPTDIEGLQPLISSGIEPGVSDACVVLRSDKSVPVQYVVNVIDAVNAINEQSGTKHKVILATSPKK